MLKYTLASTNKIKDEIRLMVHIINIVTSAFMIVYLALISIFEIGYLIPNVILLALTLVDFLTYLLTYRTTCKKKKSVKSVITHVYRISKILLNAISLAIIIYTICFDPLSVNSILLVVVPLMIILWIMQLVFEVLSLYVRSRVDLFVDGIQMDFEAVIRPINKVRNAVLGAIGEDEESDDPVSEHNRAILEEQAREDGERRKVKRKKLFHGIKKLVISKIKKL